MKVYFKKVITVFLVSMMLFTNAFQGNVTYAKNVNKLTNFTRAEGEIDWKRDFLSFGMNNNTLEYYYFDNNYSDEDLRKIGKTKNDIRLEYHYVTDDSETFVNNPNYLADRALGIAGNFHIVAFGTATFGAHTNGNVLCNTLIARANFGTNQNGSSFTEVSGYIANNYQEINSCSAAIDSNPLAVSYTTKLDVIENGNTFSLNGIKIDRPKFIYRDSPEKKYIDINAVKSEMSDVSAGLSSMSDENVVKTTECANNIFYRLTDSEALGVINLNANSPELRATDMKFTGFQSGHMGSIIVNVDCMGKDVTLPARAKIVIDGQEQNTNEVTEFSAGKIIWNFKNCAGTTITAQNMSGTIIALGATVKLTQNINGTVIAENTENTGETHRSDFTGKIRGTSAHLEVQKTFIGGDWPDGESYDIRIKAVDPTNAPLPATTSVTLSKNQAEGSFGKISYPWNDEYRGQTKSYFYEIYEEEPADHSAYIVYDKTIYEVKVDVEYNYNGIDRVANIKQFQYRIKDSGNQYTTFSLEDSKDVFKFGNSTVGSLKIVKKFTGAELTDEQKNSISFTVKGPYNYSLTVNYNEFTDGSYTITGLKPGRYVVNENGANINDFDWVMEAYIDKIEGGTAKVEGGAVTTATFINDYTQHLGNIELSKVFNGIDAGLLTNEQKRTIQFTVTGPNNYSKTISYSEFTNGKYTLKDLPVGEYTIVETGLPSIENMQATVKINGTETTSAKLTVRNGETVTAAISNEYNSTVGSLKLVKNFTGAVLTDEQKNTISFTVTGPDNYSQIVSYSEFTDGNYVLTGLKPGRYTVTESGLDFNGYSWTMNVDIDNEDNNAANVVAGGVTTVTFTNNYKQLVGSIELTKTIEGDVTEEEAEGAITFTVTGPDGTSATYTLDKFTKGEDGKYTLTLEDVVIGEYTVEETTKDVDGKNVTVTYKINSGEETEGDSAKTEVTEGETTTVDFNNEYTNDKGNLVITKTLVGEVTDEEAKNAIEFKVTAPDGTSTVYTLNDFKFDNGEYVLELNDVVIGNYTVEETKQDINGKTVTVTYTLNNGETRNGTTVVAPVIKGETAEVDFRNAYANETGKLVITKTIEGDVTEEEAEGAITFTVTGPDGNSTTYTLDKFTKGEDGKYTLELNDVVIGEYTVEETTKDVDGKNVTVTYKINSGEETEGDSAKTEVTEGETTTVDFNNSYENKKGKLVITKTIEGDVTEDEAEGAITFTVTGPNDFEETYTLKDFENEDGKYTLTLEDVVIGEYTVEETTKDVDGKNVTVTYTINSGDETEGDSAKAEVTEGETTTVDFNNAYTNDKGNLVITKTLEGEVTDEEAKAAIEFKVTAPDGTSTVYTLNDFKFDNGEYVLELNDVVIGNYTVEETKQDINGKTVTVTYTLNNGETRNGTTVVAPVIKGETAEVDFRNAYANETGKLVITKTIEGDVTEEEAEGAITFTVTGPDGNSTTYTLDKFTKGEDGKYTLTLEDVVIGEYTVEETTKDVDGKNVTVTYTINSGEETEGDSAKTEVTEGETTTVDFNNSYENKKGMLVITKTIEGDVTEEEAEGAITFTVTGPDGNSTTYTLDKFTKGEDGKYTLTLEDVVTGEYTVEETTKDVDGKNVTVTYTINSGEETEGDSAKTEVTEGETTTVDFNNSYENKKGKLVITKTIEGDVTEEEAEGAITFTVTGPDDFEETYTLKDFENEDGKYTLTLEDVVIGEYTVEETTKDVDGKNVTVTYKINSGEETEGDSAKTEVTEGETTTVDFNNSYENEKPEIPNTGESLAFAVANSLMFMSLSLLIVMIYAYKKFNSVMF